MATEVASTQSTGPGGVPNAVLYGVMAIGVAAIGAAAIFIRLAGDAEPMAIAAYRMSVGTAAVGGFALLTARHQFAVIRRRDLGWLVLAGAFLAAHFATWITSLQMTSLANSVFLVTTTPMFTAIGSHFVLRDRVGIAMVVAVTLGLGGGVILAAGEAGSQGGFGGDMLALAGAVAMAGNLLVGRRVRGHIPLLPYVTVVYGVAAVLLVASALAAGSPLTGLPTETYLWMLLAGLIPQTIGHSTLSWALAHASATTVAMSTRAEPIIATALAIPVLGEVPQWTIIPGGLLLFVGVGLALRSEVTKGR